MTAAFVILSNYLFNDKSKYCIISQKMRNISIAVDTNDDNIITDKEEHAALEILEKAKKQKKKKVQGEFLSYMDTHKYSEYS